MPKNKKKFISKENALVFSLVHRSQQDPLAVDENAPQHILKECKNKKNREEERKYGIFFDDEYDYMQHLKSVNDPATSWEQVNFKTHEKRKPKNPSTAKILLPSSVFQSDIEEPVGLLNKAAPIYGPRPELDPDIVAGLDDDFDYNNPDNILEDNFVELANKIRSDSSDEYEDNSDFSEDDFKSEISFGETKSKFTDYSMTSSVIRRNEQLTLLDDHFEKFFEKYDDNDLGCLPDNEIEGTICLENERLLRLTEDLKPMAEDADVSLKNRILLAAAEQNSDEEEMDILTLKNDEKEWDCQSILSTYSNIYNHPAKICEKKASNKITINKKTGVPMDILGNSKLTTYALSKLDETYKVPPRPKSIVSYISELSIRPKNETTEEKKIRKQNIKEFRQCRRQEKKANKLAFKEEKNRQEKIMSNLRNMQTKIKMF